MEKSYTFFLSENRTDDPPGHATCTAKEKDGEWFCDVEFDVESSEVSKSDLKAIRMALREQFEADITRNYGPSVFLWKGDRLSPLLRLQKGDRVRFKGGEGEILYVVPEQKVGVRTTDGRVLNFSFKSLEHFLFKKM